MKAPEPLRPYALALRRLRQREVRLDDLAYGRGTSYSQFGEDIVLRELFRDRAEGFYVDVGAFDPYNASNTYLLYRHGWRGINIEPNPISFRRFQQRRPRDLNLSCAVSASSDSVRLTLEGSFSGITDAEGEGVVVPARPLASILDEHLPRGQRIDLLDVDCEGHDLVVLESNDWDRFRPSVVLAEWHEGEAVRAFLEALDYSFVLRLGLTGIFVEAP